MSSPNKPGDQSPQRNPPNPESTGIMYQPWMAAFLNRRPPSNVVPAEDTVADQSEATPEPDVDRLDRSRHRKESQIPYRRPEQNRRRSSRDRREIDALSQRNPLDHLDEDYQYGSPREEKSANRQSSANWNSSRMMHGAASQAFFGNRSEVQGTPEPSEKLVEGEKQEMRTLTTEEKTIIEKHFEQDPKPNSRIIEKIALSLGVNEHRVHCYFSFLRFQKKEKDCAAEPPRKEERFELTSQQEQMLLDRILMGPIDTYDSYYYAELFTIQNEIGNGLVIEEIKMRRWFRFRLRLPRETSDDRKC